MNFSNLRSVRRSEEESPPVREAGVAQSAQSRRQKRLRTGPAIEAYADDDVAPAEIRRRLQHDGNEVVPQHRDLEPLTKPLRCSEAYDCGCDDEECSIEIGMAFIADDQSPELVDPCERPLDDPSVFSKVAAAFDASSCDAGRDGAGAQVAAAAVEVVTLVCVKLGGPFAGPTALLAYGMDGIGDIGQRHAVVAVGSRQDDCERDAGAVDHDVALGTRLAAISRVRACRVAPLLAGTDEASMEARDQSI